MAEGGTFFVTGATGFIGTRLVAELAGAGHRVRALVRPTADREGLRRDGVELVGGDILEPASLRAGMEGCSGVFHLAAYARNWAPDPATYARLNLVGARNVFAAAGEAGTGRVVHVSTIVTLGPTPPGVVADEDRPRTTSRHLTEYETTKAKAEAEAIALARQGAPIVVVNPTRVYGPGKRTEGNSVSRLIDLYDRGRMPLLLAGGRNVGNYVLVDDLVRGLVQAMERGRPGERYILGGENAELRRLLALVDEASGRRHFTVGLPGGLAMAYARLEERMARWTARYPLITPGWVETFLLDWAFSCAKAERELGYAITPLAEGIRRTYQWLVRTRKEAR